MNFLSVCSGIEAPSLAWHPLGWETAALAEVDPFPSAVLAHHYPRTPNLGDMTRAHEWPNDLKFRLLVGGTPCQSFSLAGLRKGIADPRGQLMLGFLAIAQQYRPEWMVWENVAGVLSADGGRAFGTFLGGLAELGYGFAYRVLDAQNYGVPQRRRRVFVVGRSGDWRGPAAVLFDRASLRGDSPPRGKTKQVVAALTARGVGATGVDENQGQAGHLIPVKEHSVFRTSGNCGAWESGDVSGALTTSTDPNAHVVTESFAFAENSRGEVRLEGGDGSRTGTVSTGGGKPGQGCPAIASLEAVRRLTCEECELLQGFPRHYTAIPYRGRPAEACPDGPRYAAIGNAMSVPVMRKIGERIEAVDQMLRSRL